MKSGRLFDRSRCRSWCCCGLAWAVSAGAASTAQGQVLVQGACCMPDGSCQLTTKPDCLDNCVYWTGQPNCNGVLCPIEEPVPCCLPDGSCRDLTTCECELLGGQVANGFSCAGLPVACPQPVGACCLPGGPCVITTREECFDQCGAYLGDGTVCGHFCIAEVARPCCLPDGSCVDTTSCLCARMGGTVNPGTSCATMPQRCPRDKGACCYEGDDGCHLCEILYEDECQDKCGIFLGPDTACPEYCPSDCTIPCCLPDGTCRDATKCVCDRLGGTQLNGSNCFDTTDECGCPATGCVDPVPGSPADIGSWELLPYPTPVFVVHAATMYNGRVLMFAGEVEGYQLPHDSATWDPVTGDFNVQLNAYIDDIFCAGHAELADGRICVVGGANNPGQGIRATNIFDPITEVWTKKADMAYYRWYPTALTLADGRIITFSGWVPPIVPQVEIYNPTNNTWTTLPPSANKSLEIYPSMHLLPNGDIVYTGTRWSSGTSWPNPPPTSVFRLSTNSWIDNIAVHPVANRIEGMSVQLANDLYKVMVVGGHCSGAGTQKSTEIIDMALPSPTWVTKPNTNFERKNVNGVILADGDILLCTGISGYKWSPVSDTLDAELWDVQTQTWKALAAMSVVGQYHSISLLLQDGRVLKTGGHDAGPLVFDMEVYSPPYLFLGPRPVITSAPGNVGYGQSFNVESPDACNVTRITLVRLSSITHHTNTDQRLIEPAWSYTGGTTLQLTAPANGNIAPPGYYYLFLLNDCGVPSVAAMVRIG